MPHLELFILLDDPLGARLARLEALLKVAARVGGIGKVELAQLQFFEELGVLEAEAVLDPVTVDEQILRHESDSAKTRRQEAGADPNQVIVGIPVLLQILEALHKIDDAMALLGHGCSWLRLMPRALLDDFSPRQSSKQTDCMEWTETRQGGSMLGKIPGREEESGGGARTSQR